MKHGIFKFKCESVQNFFENSTERAVLLPKIISVADFFSTDNSKRREIVKFDIYNWYFCFFTVYLTKKKEQSVYFALVI